MNKSEFMKKHDITIFAEIDCATGELHIDKANKSLESYDLFLQLVLYNDVWNLIESIGGQLLPRIWTQGNTRCILCRPNDRILVCLFYDSALDMKAEYLHAEALNASVLEMY